MIETVKALWSGSMELPIAFWRYAVIWGLIINIVTSIGTLVTVLAGAPVWLLVPVHLLPTPYNLLVVVGVWRSAELYQGDRKWAQLARLVTLVGMAILTMT